MGSGTVDRRQAQEVVLNNAEILALELHATYCSKCANLSEEERGRPGKGCGFVPEGQTWGEMPRLNMLYKSRELLSLTGSLEGARKFLGFMKKL